MGLRAGLASAFDQEIARNGLTSHPCTVLFCPGGGGREWRCTMKDSFFLRSVSSSTSCNPVGGSWAEKDRLAHRVLSAHRSARQEEGPEFESRGNRLKSLSFEARVESDRAQEPPLTEPVFARTPSKTCGSGRRPSRATWLKASSI
jgi:hypothetical protein